MCGANEVFNDKISTDTTTTNEISKYKKESILFLSTLITVFFQRSPLKFSLIG